MKSGRTGAGVLQYFHVGENGHLSEDQAFLILQGNNVLNLDMRILEKQIRCGRVDQPLIVLRSKEKYLIFFVEYIKLICFQDFCIIFNSNNKMTMDLVSNLDVYYKGDRNVCLHRELTRISSETGLSLQVKILDEALDSVFEKYKKHLNMIKPALDQLLNHIETHPESGGLKELLAVKKSLTQIQMNIQSVTNSVKTFSRECFGLEDEGALDGIFQYFHHNIGDIEIEIRILIDTIEDTDQFVSIHLDTVRNSLMKITLFIEFGALTCGLGMLVGGFFGMNLHTGLEDSKYAFAITVFLTFLFMAVVFGWFHLTYYKLQNDTTSANSFNLLKNFFTYVNDLEYYISSKQLTKREFKSAVEKIMKSRITEKENDYLFRMVDANKDGVINVEEELNLEIRNKDCNGNGFGGYINSALN